MPLGFHVSSSVSPFLTFPSKSVAAFLVCPQITRELAWILAFSDLLNPVSVLLSARLPPPSLGFLSPLWTPQTLVFAGTAFPPLSLPLLLPLTSGCAVPCCLRGLPKIQCRCCAISFSKPFTDSLFPVPYNSRFLIFHHYYPPFHARYFLHADIRRISWKCRVVFHIPVFEHDLFLLPALPHFSGLVESCLTFMQQAFIEHLLYAQYLG